MEYTLYVYSVEYDATFLDRIARVVELVDTLDSKSSAARCEGSTPSSGTRDK